MLDLGKAEGGWDEDVDLDTSPICPPSRKAAVEDLMRRPTLSRRFEEISIILLYNSFFYGFRREIEVFWGNDDVNVLRNCGSGFQLGKIKQKEVPHTLGSRPMSAQREEAALPKTQTSDVMQRSMISVVRRAIFHISCSVGGPVSDISSSWRCACWYESRQNNNPRPLASCLLHVRQHLLHTRGIRLTPTSSSTSLIDPRIIASLLGDTVPYSPRRVSARTGPSPYFWSTRNRS